MKRKFLLFSFLLFLCSSLLAEEQPVNVKADLLRYYEETGLLEASGRVEVEIDEVTITADRLWLDSKSKLLTAEGQVKIRNREYGAAADLLNYDLNTKLSRLEGFSTVSRPARLREPLYLYSRRTSDNRRVMTGEQGIGTTCDYSGRPHYFLRANKVTYYPGEKVEGDNVTMYVGMLPVFWTPYFYYDLTKRPRRNWTFGYNEVEGSFVKSFWEYPQGTFLLDLMEKKGTGYGTENPYVLGALGLGTIYLYGLAEQDTGLTSIVTRVNHEKQLDDRTKLALSQRYSSTYLIPSGRIDQTALGLNLTHQGTSERWGVVMNTLDDRLGNYQRYDLSSNYQQGRTALNYQNNYSFSKKDPAWLRNSQRLNYRTTLLADQVNLDTVLPYYHSRPSADQTGEQKIEPQLTLSGRTPGFSWTIRENLFIDLNQEEHPGELRYDFVERQPELELQPNSLPTPLANFSGTLTYGRYREVRYVPALGSRRDYTAGRYSANLRAEKTIPLGSTTNLVLGAGLDQRFYEPGDQFYALQESARLQTTVNYIKNDLAFRQGYTDGNSPFLFDQLGIRYHDIRETLTFFYLDKFSWSFDAGHNWQTNKYDPVMTRLRITPDKKLALRVDTGWDIEETKYRDLVFSLSLIPASYFATTLSFVQDMNLGEQKSGSLLYDWILLEGEPNQTRFRVSQVFDPAGRDFKVRDIMIAKKLHCWELQGNYNDYLKQLSFSFSLTALPDEPIGFSSGRGLYFEGFEKELKELTNEGGAVRRY